MTDRAARRLVALGTLALAAAAGGYVLRFGSNAPNADEWDLLPAVLADRFPWPWLAEHHNEHRYPLGRLLWAGMVRAGGFDFRPPMLLTVGLLTLASVLLADAARRVRGGASAGDLLLPALLLHWGHGFNLLFGYQAAFALFALGLAGVAWAAVRDRPWAGAGFATLAVTAGGFGLAAAPPLAGWLLWEARRRPGLLLPAAGLVGYAGWVAATLPADAAPGGTAAVTRPGSVAELLAAAGGFLGVSLGRWTIPPLGWGRVAGPLVAVAVYSLACAGLVRLARRRDARAAGIAAALLTAVAAGLAVGWGRGAGLADRFVTPSAAGLAVAWVAVAALRPPGWAGVAAAVVLVGLNLGPGFRYGLDAWGTVKRLEADLRAGLPAEYLAGRHGGTPMVMVGGRMADGLRRLRDAGAGPFRGLVADPPLAAVPAGGPLPFTLVAPVAAFLPGGPPPPRLPLAAPGRPVDGLRLHIHQGYLMGYQAVRVHWRDRATGRPGFTDLRPLAGPGWSSAAGPVGADPAEVWLEPLCPMLGLTVESAEWLVPAG